MVSPSCQMLVAWMLAAMACAERDTGNMELEMTASHMKKLHKAGGRKGDRSHAQGDSKLQFASEELLANVAKEFQSLTDTSRGVAGVLIFGDSYSDAGLEGFGDADQEDAGLGGYPLWAQGEPAAAIWERFGHGYPFISFGYSNQRFTDGMTWAQYFKLLRPNMMFNFAHGSATSCQMKVVPGKSPEVTVLPPEGYSAIPSSTGFGKRPETTIYPRGVAQQILEMQDFFDGGNGKHATTGANLTLQDVMENFLIIVATGTNDILFGGKEAVGATPADAKASPYVRNIQAIVGVLRSLGARHIALSGISAVDTMPGMEDAEEPSLDWYSSQVDAVNHALDELGPEMDVTRWPLAEWMRENMVDAEGAERVCCRAYTAMSAWNSDAGRTDLEADAATLQCNRWAEGCPYKWFDEYHPGRVAHSEMFKHFLQSGGSSHFQ